MSQLTVSGALAGGAYRRTHGPDRIRPCCCGRQLCRPHARARPLTSRFSKISIGLTGGYVGLGSLPYQAWAQACHSSLHVMWPLPLLITYVSDNHRSVVFIASSICANFGILGYSSCTLSLATRQQFCVTQEESLPLQNVESVGRMPMRMHASAFEPWLAQLPTSPSAVSAVSVDWSALLTGDRLALSGISLVLTTLYFLKAREYSSYFLSESPHGDVCSGQCMR